MLDSANQIINRLLLGQLSGKILLSETDAEKINPVGYSIVDLTQAGSAETRGLANGVEGQILIILNTAYAAATVITPDSIVGSTITFGADEQRWVGVFLSGEWHTIYSTATVG